MVISAYNTNYLAGLAIPLFPKCNIRNFYHFLSLLNYGILQFGILAKRKLRKKICCYLNFVIIFLLLMFLSNIHIPVCFSVTVLKSNQKQAGEGRNYSILQIVVLHQGKPVNQIK